MSHTTTVSTFRELFTSLFTHFLNSSIRFGGMIITGHNHWVDLCQCNHFVWFSLDRKRRIPDHNRPTSVSNIFVNIKCKRKKMTGSSTAPKLETLFVDLKKGPLLDLVHFFHSRLVVIFFEQLSVCSFFSSSSSSFFSSSFFECLLK